MFQLCPPSVVAPATLLDRVVNTPWTRYSMILFFALDGDYTVSPLPRFIAPGRPAAYPPITQDEHIEQELERATANNPEA